MKLVATFLLLVFLGCGTLTSPLHVIHIKNWHWVPKASFAIEQRESDPDLTDQQIDERYASFLDDHTCSFRNPLLYPAEGTVLALCWS